LVSNAQTEEYVHRDCTGQSSIQLKWVRLPSDAALYAGPAARQKQCSDKLKIDGAGALGCGMQVGMGGMGGWNF